MTTATADNLTRAEAQARAAHLGDVAYDINLTVTKNPAETTFRSVTTLTFTSDDGSATFLDLAAAAVVGLDVNGTAVDVAAFDDTRVHLTTLVAGTNTVRVTADCEYQHTGVGLHRIVDPVDGEVYLYTHFEPFDAHKVFACFDQPDLKGPMTMHVTAPAEWAVVSNYPVTTATTAGGMQTVDFEATPPLSTYLAAVVAGPFHSVHESHNGILLGIYCRKSLAVHLDPDEIFTLTRQGLDFFADYFACPYPFAKYDQLLVPEFNMGAMENPGCVTFNEMYVFRSKVTDASRSRRATTILHEMAHMWFGDLVTMQWWDDLWLNESFATYMAHLCIDRATRFTESWVDFAAAMKNWALRQDQLPSTHPVAADMVDTHAVHLNFDGITYAKGASVLRQLVAWVGDDAFRDGLRSYFTLHAWKNAKLADFLGALETASGRNLRSWSKEWLETAGVATLSAAFSVNDGIYTAFAIDQVAPAEYPTLRSHRIGIGLYDDVEGHLVLRRRVETDVRGARTDIAELVGERAGALVVVNDGDLAFTKIRLDTASIKALVESPHGLDDSLTRAICSSALWDMTRDAELATRDYVEIVARQALAETSVTTLERLLMQMLTAVDIYGARANRTAARRRVLATATQGFAAADPGSDVQLVWARVLVGAADDDADLDRVAGWLDHDVVDGLKVDTDLRWLILVRLSAAGRATGADIDAETERDPSDIGQRRATTALAARPTVEAKAAVWARVTGERDLALQTLNAAMAGFQQPDQTELAQPYVARYFELLNDFWTTRGVEEAQALTEGLFPTFLIGSDVIAGADAALAAATLTPMALRILSECRDGALRAQRGRVKDEAATS